MVPIPWCETCAKYLEQDDLAEEGKCPGCGEIIAQRAKTPWHFKLLVVGTTIYLLYRLGQGIDWLERHVHF